jgi:hypothetical protein
MDNRILQAGVALRAFTAGPDKIRSGLIGFNLGPGAIDEERRENQGEGDGYGDEDRTKRHANPTYAGTNAPIQGTYEEISGSLRAYRSEATLEKGLSAHSRALV